MRSRSRQFPRRRSLSANLHASRDRAQAAKTPHGSAGAGGRPGRPLDLGAESRGRGGLGRPKACGQVALAAEAAVQSDAGNRQGCHGQQLAGLLQARGHDVAMWGLARGFLKEAAEMREADLRPIGEHFRRQVFGEVLMDVVEHRLETLEMRMA